MSLKSNNHALVFGSSGVSGWALVNQLLSDFPETGIWDQVTALTNRPLTRQASLWPDEKRLDIVSGIDLLKGSQEDLEKTIADRIPDISSVTHVFYYAYKSQLDVQKELKDAVDMLDRSITAVDHLSHYLNFIVLQTGCKTYGFYLRDDHYFPTPLKESLPRLKKPFYDDIFYYPQLDFMIKYSEGKRWKWIETRPDVVIGFVPNLNAHSLGEMIGIYLALWTKVHGRSTEVPFPGNEGAWKAKHNEAGADMVAKQTIFFALHPEACEQGEAFNVASTLEYHSWKVKWPIIASYFGLKGVPPVKNYQTMSDFVHAHEAEWHKLEDEYGLKKGVMFADIRRPELDVALFENADFDRHIDMSKIQSRGFAERCSVMETWGALFDRMKQAKIIP